jgi:exopolysaccharide production protein ExoZ
LIGNLQVLRALAALGVVFYHTDFRLPGDWHTEFFGVSTFFVISGFIMCFITKDNADNFLAKRALRIVPLYWVCTIALVVMGYRWGLLWPSTWTTTTALASDLPRSLLFLPSQKMPLLGVGWTLNFEVYFYAVFAAALGINRRFAPLIAAGIVYAVFTANELGANSFLITYYSHGYIHYFLYGIGLFYIWTFTKDYLPRWPVIIICAGIVIVSYGSQFVTQLWYANPTAQYWAGYIPLAVVAAALFSAGAGADIKWRPLLLLGDASYAIYLTHTIFIEWVRVENVHGTISIVPPKESVLVMIGYLFCSTVIGVAVHLWIEKPMGRLLKTRLRAALNISRPRFRTPFEPLERPSPNPDISPAG